jgi:prepilin-type N-terminal cleavage/methylation domain-containing protein
MLRSTARGYTLTELIVVIAVIGILAVLGLPMFLTYWRAATLRAGSEELVTVLNNARQLAISSNNIVCVTRSAATSVQYHVGSCGSAVYIGQNTDGNGNVNLATAVQIANDPRPIFTYLGAAPPGGVFTVQNPVNGSTRTVTVMASGRITTP